MSPKKLIAHDILGGKFSFRTKLTNVHKQISTMTIDMYTIEHVPAG